MRLSELPASLYHEPDRSDTEISWGALEFADVFKIFGTGAAQTVALRGLDLRIEHGEMVAIVGPSGSGKSTLISLAAGLDRPSAGEVRADEHSLPAMDELELAEYRSSKIALVFQSDNLWPTLSAEENVSLALRLAGVEDVGARARAALDEFGLGDRRAHLPRALSGGEQQRVAIAAAAGREAAVLLADEPTGELDGQNEARVLTAFEHLRTHHGSTVVIVTHSEVVAAACDRIVTIRDGKAS
jgi:putative ABC transport system ATP-binding protein